MSQTIDPPPFFSIIIPVYNEAENLRPLQEEILGAMKEHNRAFEVLFIDDGSRDNTPEVLKQLRHQDPRFKVITFRKNFGKSAALACGFQQARGKFVATLDGDLQDDPRELEPMLAAMQAKKADLVGGWKRHRKDPVSKLISSRLFNAAARFLTGVQLHDFNCGIKLYRQAVVKEIPMYGELHRSVPALAAWKGFAVIEHPVHHRARRFGQSKFGMKRFFGGVVDLLTVVFMMRYEGKPSHLFSGTGLLFFSIGMFINTHLLIRKLMGGTVAPHYPYFIFGIAALIIGVQFIFFGLLSEMIVYASKSKKLNQEFPLIRHDAD